MRGTVEQAEAGEKSQSDQNGELVWANEDAGARLTWTLNTRQRHLYQV